MHRLAGLIEHGPRFICKVWRVTMQHAPIADDCVSAEQEGNASLSQHGIATVPGSGFYSNPEDGRHQVRLCYAKKEDEMVEACRRIK